MTAFTAGDLATAREEQFRSVQLIDLLAGYGYMAAAKAVMGFLGIDVGPARLPHANLPDERRDGLRAELDRLGFFQWREAQGERRRLSPPSSLKTRRG
jgi:N-acetylneuraminate lyase